MNMRLGKGGGGVESKRRERVEIERDTHTSRACEPSEKVMARETGW